MLDACLWRCPSSSAPSCAAAFDGFLRCRSRALQRVTDGLTSTAKRFTRTFARVEKYEDRHILPSCYADVLLIHTSTLPRSSTAECARRSALPEIMSSGKQRRRVSAPRVWLVRTSALRRRMQVMIVFPVARQPTGEEQRRYRIIRILSHDPVARICRVDAITPLVVAHERARRRQGIG